MRIKVFGVLAVPYSFNNTGLSPVPLVDQKKTDNMQSLVRLFAFLYLLGLEKCVSSQTTSSIYYPGLVNSGGETPDDVLLASIAGSSGGTTTFVLTLSSTNQTALAELPSAQTVTLMDAPTTAHLSGTIPVDNQGDVVSLDIQCDIKGNVSTCQETDIVIANGTTITTFTTSYIESFSLAPVTLVASLTAAATPSPSAADGSNPSPSPPPKGGSTQANQTGSSTTPGSSPTSSPNGASYHTVSYFLCAIPVVMLLSMMMF
ncbi:hypothetical protein Clacol_005032 [Clathrus columnatus]|uniref:Uncharacterized protein n=1 Tax=Clathrus columnatus TaxID=1419009 RepID=A0AAV5AC79_9AGAM|nr:hypothetical protein Clacol_005032 [Clathrus columnatus]